MNTIRYLWITLIQTLFRMFPFPTRTGLTPIGNPGRDAQVLLTGNFRLTVERVKRALRGLDAYLLVANSGGVNVWCASTGGMLTNHQVVSVLKTSGITDRVDHRRVILPQLAATGIDGGEIKERTGWRVIWGPVEATAIPAFLQAGMQASRPMRTVRFPWSRRLEMAVAWAFPISVLALIALLFWKPAVLPMIGLIWLFSLIIFLSFPLYEHLLQFGTQHEGFVFFDFRQARVPLIFWALFLCGLIGISLLSGTFTWTLVLRWGLISLCYFSSFPWILRAVRRFTRVACMPTDSSGSPWTRIDAGAPPSVNACAPSTCSWWTIITNWPPFPGGTSASSAAPVSFSVPLTLSISGLRTAI